MTQSYQFKTHGKQTFLMFTAIDQPNTTINPNVLAPFANEGYKRVKSLKTNMADGTLEAILIK